MCIRDSFRSARSPEQQFSWRTGISMLRNSSTDVYKRQAKAALRVALQWFFLAVPMGLLCGFLGTLFHLAVEHATELRAAQPWLLFLLPVAGLLINALYKVTKCEGVGTNNVIRAVQSGEPVSILLVPAIFLGTVLTHLCGGSAGREGAALQMGGSIGWNLGTLLRLTDHDRRTATISGMAAFFSALFGTPLAAACFAMMVEDVGLTFTSAFVPAFTSALIAYGLSLIHILFISLTHFKGHESTGFGGALKNIGMGCGSRAGKMEQHAAGKPAVQEGLCRGCHRCAKECGSDAITYNAENKAVIDYDKCKGCGRCIGACSFDAIYSPNDCANELLDRKMAEYAAAVCHDRPCFHVSLVQDISPNCDCHCENDAPILPDIGIFASFDPVALDQACVDACLNAAPLPNSQLGANLAKPGWNCYHDNFKDSNPNIEWKATLEQAEKVGMGTRQYVLKKV